MAPSIFDIAEFAEGVERDVKGGKVKGDGKKKKIESNEKILGNTIVRLLPCAGGEGGAGGYQQKAVGQSMSSIVL